MQFNAKDDFVNEYQAELEQELDAEQKLEDEQDNGYDNLDAKKGLTEEQLHNFREQNIKAMYAKLYQMGLKTEGVRARLDKMSMFFGNIGAVSNMSDDEIAAVNRMLDELQVRGYKFS
jgi:hypothetical protein